MDSIQMETLIIWTMLSRFSVVLCFFQLKEKGFSLNNAYFYASTDVR